MATGLGFCPTCGTAKTEADQKFCASCGATLAAPPQPPAPVAAMPVAPPPPPAYVPAAPPPPPAYAPPPPPAYAPPPPYAPQQAWGGQPFAPAAPAKAAVSPTMLLIGAVVILAIVGAAFYMMNNNSYPGTLAFSPTTVNCGQTYTTTIRLPSSVKSTDQITLQDNGKTVVTQSVSDVGLQQQADGSWSASDTSPADCSIGAGAHTERLLDANGKVLAQGSFTLVGSASTTPTAGAGTPAPATQAATEAPTEAPTPTEEATPAPTEAPSLPPSTSGSSTTIDPSSFSCSAADEQIVLTIRLSASIPGTAEVTSEIDGNTGDTGTVSSGFEKQADGSWLSSAPESSQTLCSELGTGQHTIGALDSNGQVITQGTFTINP
jgi:hypothetical protein